MTRNATPARLGRQVVIRSEVVRNTGDVLHGPATVGAGARDRERSVFAHAEVPFWRGSPCTYGRGSVPAFWRVSDRIHIGGRSQGARRRGFEGTA